MNVFYLEYTVVAIVLLFYSCSVLKAIVGEDRAKELFRRKNHDCRKPCA